MIEINVKSDLYWVFSQIISNLMEDNINFSCDRREETIVLSINKYKMLIHYYDRGCAIAIKAETKEDIITNRDFGFFHNLLRGIY